MNESNFSGTGGYPLNSERLQELQQSFGIFNQLGWALGNHTIIDGCIVNGSVVSDGYVFIDGEVYPFIGGNIQANVRIIESTKQRAFKSGTERTVYIEKHVQFANGTGAIPWANFKRPDNLIALTEKLESLETGLTAAQTKLATIEEGAEVNVQPDFSQTDSSIDDFIKNKPNLEFYLMRGTYDVPDVTGGDERTITFPGVGTSNYLVVGSLVSLSSNANNDNDVIWAIRSKSAGSFILVLREVSGVTQNLQFNYALIPY